jgi:uncharacterized protein (TIRG00374 family)
VTDASPPVPAGGRGRAIRALVSAGLLGVLLWRTDLRAIAATVRAADVAWLAAALLLHVPGYLVSAVRWQLLLRTQRLPVPLGVLLRSYLVGTFFNQLLPTTVGGDVVRVFDTARYTGAREAAFLAVLIERLTGVLALGVLALLGLGVSLGRVGGAGLTAMVAAMILLTAIPTWLVWSPRLLGPALGLARRRGGARVQGLVDRGEQALALFGKARGSLLAALALGFLLQILVVAHFYLIARALDLGLPLGYLFLVVPVATFVLMLPVSINGIGVREGVFALFFAEFGVPVAGAIAFAWLGFGMALVYGAVGGVLYAIRR